MALNQRLLRSAGRGKTFMVIRPRTLPEKSVGVKGHHWPRQPDDLPDDFERWGICTCGPCDHPRFGRTAWADARDWLEEIGQPSHSDEWRSLSYHVGDDLADWLCCWADLQPYPKKSISALVACADLKWQASLQKELGPPDTMRRTLYNFIKESFRIAPRTCRRQGVDSVKYAAGR
jgi:hypothetical protein